MLLLNQIKDRSANIGVIGLGYVGLPLAATIAQAGYCVTGFDVDPTKIEMIENGTSYIDAVSDETLSEIVRKRTFKAETDFTNIAQMQVIIICVPTPLDTHQAPDLSFVKQTARTIAKHVKPQTLIVLESTTWPGTTEEVVAPVVASSGHVLGTDLFLAYSPEREDPGNTQYDTKTIPKVVAGMGSTAGQLTEAFYSSVVEKVVCVPNTRTAEAVKITENVFRSVNIALVNELKTVFETMDIDIWEVIDAAATKPFGYMPFYPGPGLGGHCIPVDPFYLTWKAAEYDIKPKFIELAGEINTAMPKYVINKLREVIDQHSQRGLHGAEILIVGVAYKKNVSDMRESPAMKLMQLLDKAGATVSYVDPHVPKIPSMREYQKYEGYYALNPDQLRTGAFTAVLIATDHDAIDYEQLLTLECPIIDTRNAMEKRNLRSILIKKA